MVPPQLRAVQWCTRGATASRPPESNQLRRGARFLRAAAGAVQSPTTTGTAPSRLSRAVAQSVGAAEPHTRCNDDTSFLSSSRTQVELGRPHAQRPRSSDRSSYTDNVLNVARPCSACARSGTVRVLKRHHAWQQSKAVTVET
eukprot:5718662-Prymnesium_polylepis.2